MTREEAIEEINKVFEPAFANYIITALTEGVTASDKALEQESCDDCISRQSVKRKLQEHHDLFINAYGGRVGFKSMADAKEKARVDEITNCIGMIVNEPSVIPKEKTGKWIDTCPGYYDSYVKNAHRCSNCRNYYTLDWKEMNFCPNCGARMVSE